MKTRGFKLVIKAPKVRQGRGLLVGSGRTFRSGKVYNRKASSEVL